MVKAESNGKMCVLSVFLKEKSTGPPSPRVPDLQATCVCVHIQAYFSSF